MPKITFLLLFCFGLQNLTLATSLPFNKQDTDSVRLLNWNVFMLPAFLGNTGQVERAASIVEKLKDGFYDVLVFQEVFHRKAFQVLQVGLEEVFPYHTGKPKGRKFYNVTHGVWVLSKYPIVDMKSIFFNDCKGIDCFSSKAAILVEIEKENRCFQLVATHLQSMDGEGPQKVRLAQYIDIRDKLLEPFRKLNVPQFIVGDLNTAKRDHPAYAKMLSIFQAKDGKYHRQDGEEFSYDGNKNRLIGAVSAGYRELLDYVLDASIDQVVEISRKIRQFVARWKDDNDEWDLSDHFAIEAVIYLPGVGTEALRQ